MGWLVRFALGVSVVDKGRGCGVRAGYMPLRCGGY